jgi:Tol biopolymer transport system component
LRARRLLSLASLLMSITGPLGAQDIIRSSAPWRSLQTRWFDVHYPLDAEAWALDLAPRLDAMRDAVAALVGYAPTGRTTFLIDDPYNVANGKAIPLLGAPTVHLWVTPPGPSDQIANHRGWGLKLASHEFGHIAHLSRPVRRPQWYWRLLPARISPIAISTPRWATEGYATWIEGKITGSGRPHGAWRPALLRELALAGRLPSYGAMSGGGGYKGGSMAYLAGSAFFEWLAAQRGDSSMVLLFRRQTARTSRSFDDAFRGVYGDAPAVLYGRFSAELTAKSFMADTLMRAAGLVTGTQLAHFGGGVGGPAASADGKRIALALPGLNGAQPRIIVTAPDTQPISTVEKQQVQRQLRRDSLDVPAIRVQPRLVKPIATLTPRRGRSFANPRFIDRAGTQVLLESWSVRADGSQRPDLATWNVTTGAHRFITDGAAVQDADPSPDGTRATAIRCTGGSCDLTLVTLSTGAVTTLVRGSPTRVFNHPRWSPDGSRIVTGLQESDGLWRLALVDPASGALTVVTPNDDINRHSASFDARGESLVYVSEAGGIPNVETLHFSDSARVTRTRVSGSVYEPAPMADGSVVFLIEYAGGMDLHRIAPGTTATGDALAADAGRLVPAMPRAREPGITLDSAAVPPPHPYGIGPRTIRFAAQAALARDGLMHAASIVSADPANRFVWSLSAMGGTAPAWRGGVASAAWYGTRPSLRAEALWLEQRATRQWNAADVDAENTRIAGASLAAELPRTGSSLSQRMAISIFGGATQLDGAPRQLRGVLSVQYALGGVVGWRKAAGLSTRGAIGTLGDSTFARATMASYLTMRRIRLDARVHLASQGTPLSEQFSGGGFAPPLTDNASLGQRIAFPALPTGIARGREVYELRIERPAPFVPGTVYAHGIGTTWRLDRHSAVIGIEQGFDADYLGLVGLPRLRALGGVARVISGPLRDKGSAYLMIAWRP